MTQVFKTMNLQFASPEERQDGWTLSPKFLKEVQSKISYDEDCPSLEGIELVLLAYFGLIK